MTASLLSPCCHVAAWPGRGELTPSPTLPRNSVEKAIKGGGFPPTPERVSRGYPATHQRGRNKLKGRDFPPHPRESLSGYFSPPSEVTRGCLMRTFTHTPADARVHVRSKLSLRDSVKAPPTFLSWRSGHTTHGCLFSSL